MHNTSNTAERTTAHKIEATGKVVMAALEMWVLAEILWYYLHDGEQTLHEAMREWAEQRRERFARAAEIARTNKMIRDLPETK